MGIQINGKGVKMEVDTGTSITFMSENTYKELWPNSKEALKPSQIKLKTYTGQQIQVHGSKMVQVQYGKQAKRLPLVVVNGSRPTLLGRDWLKEIRLDWGTIFKVGHYFQSGAL